MIYYSSWNILYSILKYTLWPGDPGLVTFPESSLLNLNLSYNTSLSPIHRSKRLTELKTLINILESEARFQSNSLAFRFTCQCLRNMLINSNFRENSDIFVAFFEAPTGKPKQIFIRRARLAFRHFIAINWACFDPGHIPKSYFAIIDLRSLYNGYFPQEQLSSTPKNRTNIECQILPL